MQITNDDKIRSGNMRFSAPSASIKNCTAWLRVSKKARHSGIALFVIYVAHTTNNISLMGMKNARGDGAIIGWTFMWRSAAPSRLVNEQSVGTNCESAVEKHAAETFKEEWGFKY